MYYSTLNTKTHLSANLAFVADPAFGQHAFDHPNTRSMEPAMATVAVQHEYLRVVRSRT